MGRCSRFHESVFDNLYGACPINGCEIEAYFGELALWLACQKFTGGDAKPVHLATSETGGGHIVGFAFLYFGENNAITFAKDEIDFATFAAPALLCDFAPAIEIVTRDNGFSRKPGMIV